MKPKPEFLATSRVAVTYNITTGVVSPLGPEAGGEAFIGNIDAGDGCVISGSVHINCRPKHTGSTKGWVAAKRSSPAVSTRIQ